MVLMLDGDSEMGARVSYNFLFYYLFKAFDKFGSSHKSDNFYLKRPIFLYECATCSELNYLHTMEFAQHVLS